MPARTWLCLGLLVAVLWLFQKAKRFLWPFALLVLVGTLCHEACHWVAGLVLNGRPVAFSVQPRREQGQIHLGEVRLQNLRWYNAFFIGMAPLAMLPAACWLFQWLLSQPLPLGPLLLLGLFLVANLAYGAIPSWTDCHVAAKSPVGWLLLAAGCVWIWTGQPGGLGLLPRPLGSPPRDRALAPVRPPTCHSPAEGRPGAALSGAKNPGRDVRPDEPGGFVVPDADFQRQDHHPAEPIR